MYQSYDLMGHLVKADEKIKLQFMVNGFNMEKVAETTLTKVY